MTRLSISVLLVALLFIASCKVELFNDDCTEGIGSVEFRTITLPEIDKIHLEFQYDLELVETGSQNIEIEAASNIIDIIERESMITNKTWHLGPNLGSFCDLPIKIKGSFPGLKEIRGDGIFTLKADQQLDDVDSIFTILSTGVGDIDLDFGHLHTLHATTGGPGKIQLSGVAKNLILEIATFGSVKAHNMKTEFAEVTINGSGVVEVNASDSLDINFNSGSADVCYKGFPSININRLSGTGELRDCN